MSSDFYLKWYGFGILLAAIGYLFTRVIQSKIKRLTLCCFMIAAVITPQPLWAPGDGGAIVPAAMLLLSLFEYPKFALLNGFMPIVSVAAILFSIGGYLFSIRESKTAIQVHDFVQIWVLLGLLLPLLLLIVWSPFLAFFFLGGVTALYSSLILVILFGALVLDKRKNQATKTTFFQKTSLVILGLSVGCILTMFVYRILKLLLD